MKKTTVYLSEEAAEKLLHAATSTGRPQAEIVRDAITEYVAKIEPKRKFRSAGAGSSGRKKGTSIANEDLHAAVADLVEQRLKDEGSWRSSSTPDH